MKNILLFILIIFYISKATAFVCEVKSENVVIYKKTVASAEECNTYYKFTDENICKIIRSNPIKYPSEIFTVLGYHEDAKIFDPHEFIKIVKCKDKVTQECGPAPHFKLKNSQCLPSCGHAGTLVGLIGYGRGSKCTNSYISISSHDTNYCCVKAKINNYLSELLPYSNTEADSSGLINYTINNTPKHGYIKLPKGRYTVNQAIEIYKPLNFQTYEKDRLANDKSCVTDESHDCFELRPSINFTQGNGFFRIKNTSNVTILNIVLNGRKHERQGSQAEKICRGQEAPPDPYMPSNRYGYNMIISDSLNIFLKGNVIKNAVCGTGLELHATNQSRLYSNSIVQNGTHNVYRLWADGITHHDGKLNAFFDNYFADNTDVDLIFGGCQQCVVMKNKITHTRNLKSTGSYAGIMLHAWPSATSGDFTNSFFIFNNLTCNGECGFGIYLGGNAWYANSDAINGLVYGNTIDEAHAGLVVDNAVRTRIEMNMITNSTKRTKCHYGEYKNLDDYVIAPQATTITLDIPGDSPNLLKQSVRGCIPNGL